MCVEHNATARHEPEVRRRRRRRRWERIRFACCAQT